MIPWSNGRFGPFSLPVLGHCFANFGCFKSCVIVPHKMIRSCVQRQTLRAGDKLYSSNYKKHFSCGLSPADLHTSPVKYQVLGTCVEFRV